MGTPSEDLRRIIAACGLSRYEIARRTGVSEAALSKFMSGRDIRTDTLDRLAPLLGLRLVTDIRRGRSLKKGNR